MITTEGTIMPGRRNVLCVDSQLYPLHFLGFLFTAEIYLCSSSLLLFCWHTLNDDVPLDSVCYQFLLQLTVHFALFLSAPSKVLSTIYNLMTSGSNQNNPQHFFASYISGDDLKMLLIHCIFTARLTCFSHMILHSILMHQFLLCLCCSSYYMLSSIIYIQQYCYNFQLCKELFLLFAFLKFTSMTFTPDHTSPLASHLGVSWMKSETIPVYGWRRETKEKDGSLQVDGLYVK